MSKLRWLRAIFRLTAIGIGALHTWAAAVSYSMNPDGISYLDIGDAIWQGDWGAAVNPVWSPLYPGLLGLVMRLTQPSMRWEFPVVHLINFGIYLFALVCFEFFWRQLSKYREAVVSANRVTWPRWLWEGVGYALFLWTALVLIEIWAVTPDMLMAGLVYLASTLIVGFRLGEISWKRYVFFGALLGLGYLAKAVMWPLSIVFLGVALFSFGEKRRVLPRWLTAGATFIVITGPLVAAVSGPVGGFSYSETGTMAYIRYVNGIPYPHWQGEEEGFGSPLHPSRKILDEPPVYEFGTPVKGTYPISYNPFYWYAGAAPDYSLGEWLLPFAQNSLYYLELFFQDQAALVMGVLLLYGLALPLPQGLRNVLRRWGLVLPAVAALTAYSLVYVEGRYLGVFLVLIWADLLANVNLPKNHLSPRLFRIVGGIILLFLLFNLLFANADGFESLIATQRGAAATTDAPKTPSWPGETAIALHALGVEPGSEVAVIGDGFNAFWARLARVRIAAEMLEWETSTFWLGGDHERTRVLNAFESTGVEAIVAEGVPSNVDLAGWYRVNDSNYYIYLLESQK